MNKCKIVFHAVLELHSVLLKSFKVPLYVLLPRYQANVVVNYVVRVLPFAKFDVFSDEDLFIFKAILLLRYW